MQLFRLQEKLKNEYLKQGLKISCAESCTGGMLACALTELPGSSAIFDRGFITYSNNAKIELLGVSAKTLAEKGAVSEEVAREMALGALLRSDANVAVSVTGIAGPGGSEFKPEGCVHFSLAYKKGTCITHKMEFGAIGRKNVRLESCRFALKCLCDAQKKFGTN